MSLELARLRIVGLPYHAGPEVWDLIQQGQHNNAFYCTLDGMITFALRPEPNNRNDRNALEVIIPAHATQSGQEMKLGYVRRQDAPEMGEVLKNASHLGLALDPNDLPEPVEKTIWRGLVETDVAHLAPGALKVLAPRSGPFWPDMQGRGGSAPSKRTRPKTRKRLVHAWF